MTNKKTIKFVIDSIGGDVSSCVML